MENAFFSFFAPSSFVLLTHPSFISLYFFLFCLRNYDSSHFTGQIRLSSEFFIKTLIFVSFVYQSLHEKSRPQFFFPPLHFQRVLTAVITSNSCCKAFLPTALFFSLHWSALHSGTERRCFITTDLCSFCGLTSTCPVCFLNM